MVAAVVMTLALGGPIARALGAGTDLMRPATSRTYVVRAGDTLWSIARSIAPERDPREVIHRLEALDPALDGELRPGQVLSIPSAI